MNATAQQTSERTGGCLCGAVTFAARDVPPKVGVCHCPSCQRWTGSALFEVSIPMDKVDWHGDMQIYTSTGWGERAFCPVCGSALYFRVTEQGEWSGNYDIPLGLFDDKTGFDMSHEIYVDHAIIQLADQGHVRLTRAECVAKFPRLNET